MTHSWSLSGDLARGWIVAAVVLAAASALLLLYELRREGGVRHGAGWVAATGLLAVVALLAAVLRPVQIQERGASLGARLVVLVDASRSIDLPADDDGTRRDVIAATLPLLAEHFADARTTTLVFGSGKPSQLVQQGEGFGARPQLSSDLSVALETIAVSTTERPQALVVVSDGRLDRPGPERTADHLRSAMGELQLPVHTVAIASEDPRDAAIVNVGIAGTVVAHEPATLTVEIACTGGLTCGDIRVEVRELHLDTAAVVRAAGVATIQDGRATIELDIVLDRAGKRILEVDIDTPEGDAIAENDRRFLTVDVARDRVRLLHVAGRPTYDVRALRTWLKSDASVDVVAFFILRTHDDNVIAPQEELALIPFPVDELFTVHLPSFDAVILQDFDANPYGLSKHLRSLSRYVDQGGGLIMVGGPNAFVMGGYARTALADVLPVGLDGIARADGVDLAGFTPRVTAAGRHAPVLEPLTAVIAGALPEMPGTNVVGDPRAGATVLLEHPSRTTKSGRPMPVLALGEHGSGRTIALTVDGSHRLLFSTFAVGAAGRGHGAFWDALLGWLMRDPRFEPAKVEVPAGCIAGDDTELELRAVFVEDGATADLSIARMGSGEVVVEREVALPEAGKTVTVPIGKLAAGGYTTTVRLDREARSAPSHYDFACEVGGDEWADPRPDRARLETIATATGGRAVDPAGIEDLPPPPAADVVAERRVDPLVPPWTWTLIAAACLGGHWVMRRRSGLS